MAKRALQRAGDGEPAAFGSRLSPAGSRPSSAAAGGGGRHARFAEGES